MGGGLLQLVSIGPQDIYFIGNPQITFLKIVYRQHTRFSINTTENFFSTELNFGSRSSIIIPKSGDLLSNMFLKITLPELTAESGKKVAWVRKIGYSIIDNIEVLIGGKVIDRQYGIWMYIWNELSRNSNHDDAYDILLGNNKELTELKTIIPSYDLYINLNFWFCKHVGSAFPIISLDKHNIVVNVTLNKKDNLIIYTGKNKPYIPNIKYSSLFIDYIYLDKLERRKFTSIEQEYLIEQTQFMGEEQFNEMSMNFNLGFNRPVKELFWAVRNGFYVSDQSFIYYNLNESLEENIENACSRLVFGLCYLNIDGTPNWTPKVEDNSMTVWNDSGVKYIEQEFFLNSSDVKLIKVSVVFDSNITNENKTNGFAMFNNVAFLSNKIDRIKLLVKSNSIEILSMEHTLNINDISYPINTWLYDRRNEYSKENDYVINDPLNFSLLINNESNPVYESSLTLNGTYRIDQFPGIYFNYYHPEKYHSNTPSDGINVYSFAISPEEHQPSGTCDLSYISKSIFNVKVSDSNILNSDKSSIFIFGINYNIIKIMEGYANISYK